MDFHDIIILNNPLKDYLKVRTFNFPSKFEMDFHDIIILNNPLKDYLKVRRV